MRTLAAAALACALLGCSSPQPVDPDVRRPSVTWTEDISPITVASCDSCHSGSGAAADYHTDSYLGTIAKATAGDASSKLVTVLAPATADATHQPFAAAYPKIREWVVTADLAFTRSEVHAGGILNPADADFHGKLIVSTGYDLASCQVCHGTDFAGGKAGASTSCLSCHTGGPTSCTTCHGQPPATGAHDAHVNGAKSLDCTECHTKPAVYTDAGHLHPPPGKVTFGALAGTSAAFSAQDKTCSGVYCHGATFTDSAATLTAPKWTAGSEAAACGTCHGLPPSGHQKTGTDCSACHSLVIDSANHFVDAGKHIDGMVELAGGSGCTSCHGQPPATGAHVAHIAGSHGLATPVACAECHAVPATDDAPGHIDEDVQVFPAVAGVGTIARADGASPTWTAASESCQNVYCHGGGTTFAADHAAGLRRTPTWTEGNDAIGCGSCHGVPPDDGKSFHTSPKPTLADCVQCHADTVEANGSIKVTNGVSKHMDGVIDAHQ